MTAGGPPSWIFWVFVVRGSVALALGVALLLSGDMVSNLGTFVAVYWIIGAVLTLRWVAQHRSAPGWRVGSVAGLIGVVVGIMFLVRELLYTFIEEGLLLDLLGLSAVAMGLLRLLGGFHDDQIAGDRPRLRYRVVVGTLDIVLGVALLIGSATSASQIRLALVAWGLLTGTFLLLDALRLRRLVSPSRPGEQM